MQRTTTAFTFTLPLRPVVRRRLQTRHTRHGLVNRRQELFQISHGFLKRTIACVSSPPTESSADVCIRRATQSDIPTAARVLAAAFSGDFLTQESAPTPLLSILLPLYEFMTGLEIYNQLHRRVKHEKHAILLAEIDNQAVGCAEVGVLDIKSMTRGGDEVNEWGKGGSEAYVGNVGVLTGYRGRGIGRGLVKSAEKAAEEWGLGCVWLCVEARNDGAVRFYERLGFGCVAQEPDWFDEIGKRRRFFLCSCKGNVAEWEKSKTVGGKLGVMEYLRYCFLDLRRRREARERHNS